MLHFLDFSWCILVLAAFGLPWLTLSSGIGNVLGGDVEDGMGFCAPSVLNVGYVAVVCSCERPMADFCFYVPVAQSLDYPCRYLGVQTQYFPSLGHAVSKCRHFHFYIAAGSKPTPCSVGGADVQGNAVRGVLGCAGLLCVQPGLCGHGASMMLQRVITVYVIYDFVVVSAPETKNTSTTDGRFYI